MNNLLWLLQILLGILFIFAGVVKFIMPAEKLAEGTPSWMPLAFIYFIGVCEILGGVGLILPWLTNTKPVLTPVAAAGLVIIMIGATVVTVPLGVDKAVFPAIIGLLLALVAYGRFNSLKAA
jgi:uncharacterized membrane protein